MSRRHAAVKRQILPDAKYNDLVVAKFINCVMKEGKKSIAEAIVYEAFDMLQSKSEVPALEAFKKALDNVKPSVEVRSKRIGGATYQVPCDVREVRKVALGMKWLITYSLKRSEKTMKERLAAELVDALNNRGQAVKKREEVFKMAEANKAFSHFR